MRLFWFPLLAMLAIGPAFGQTRQASTDAPSAMPDEGTPAAKTLGKKVPGAHHRRTAKQRFEEANTTHDGKLTLEQAQAAKMTRVAKNFDAIDTEHKGYVTPAEIKAYNKAQRAAKKAAKSGA